MLRKTNLVDLTKEQRTSLPDLMKNDKKPARKLGYPAKSPAADHAVRSVARASAQSARAC